MSPLAQQGHEQGGLAGIRKLRALDDVLKYDGELEAFSHSLGAIHQKLASVGAPLLCTVADEPNIVAASEASCSHAAALTAVASDGISLAPVREARQEMWVTNTQVNFCAKAYPTVPSGHADAPALSVLSAFLRNGFLHRTIREQGGAYGGGASHDPNIAAFRFFSYRDPRLVETLEDFDAAIEWMLQTQHEQLALEEAILSVMGSLDKPGSPAGEAKRDFHERLFGRTAEHRKILRAGIVGTTIDDLHRVTETYLKHERARTAVITHSGGADIIAERQLPLTRQDLL